MLMDDMDTFLCIKSCPCASLDEPLIGAHSEKITGQRIDKKTKTTNFTALCNLSEYKSCTVRAVMVNNRESFAIRLVPAGVIGNKQLLLASLDEDEVTTWQKMCNSRIGKKARGLHMQRDNISTAGTLSKAGSFMSLKPITGPLDFDLDEGLLDNEVYESYSSDDKIPALLEEAGDWTKMHLNSPECFIRLTEERLEVLDAATEKPVHWFPYLLIRRFGAANGVLRVDAGRRCSTGDGRFFFRCSPPNGQPVDVIVTQIRQFALEAKQRSKRNPNGANPQDAGFATMPRNSITPTSDLGGTSLGSLNDEMKLGANFNGTMPPLKSRKSRAGPTETPALELPVRANGSAHPVSNGSVDNSLVKLESEKQDTTTSSEESELVKATPGRASRECDDSADVSNLYDNLPRPPRKGAKLPGSVNVLPLPIRARSTNGNASRERLFEVSSSTSSSPQSNSQIASSQEIQRPPRLSLSKDEGIAMSKEQPRSATDRPSSRTESLTSPTETKRTRRFPQSTERTEASKEFWWNHPAPPPIPSTEQAQDNDEAPIVRMRRSTEATVNRSSTPTTPTDSLPMKPPTPTAVITPPTAVMRVPPFTAPKPKEATRHSSLNRMSNSQDDKSESSNHFPMPLSCVMNTKVSSTSVYLRGSHPNMKKETVHCTQVNIQPTPGVAAMVNKINSEWSGEKAPSPEKSEESNASSIDTAPMEDTKNYLSQLDSVIKELCEANEAAVQATREAARRRHQLGWPSKCKEKNVPFATNRC